MKKKLFCLAMVLVFAVSALAFAGCGTDELKKQVDELQTKVEVLQDQINVLDDISTREIEVKVGFSYFGAVNIVGDEIEKIVTTYEDWQAQLKILQKPQYDPESLPPQYVDQAKPETLILSDQYTENYFARKALIVLSVWENPSWRGIRGVRATKEKRECFVEMEMEQSEIAIPEQKHIVIVLEVCKADVQRVEKLQYHATEA